MSRQKLLTGYFSGKMSNLRIGQRLVICMMIVITILVLPIILVMAQALNHQKRYNQTLDNLRSGDSTNDKKGFGFLCEGKRSV